ncbi:MAG TPA: ABC transporter substrate-binding protein [Syntrophobacter fumaroxidans]|nr:ABC transporter substrate-binding protein [Syntrophobacter fumaroxidans]
MENLDRAGFPRRCRLPSKTGMEKISERPASPGREKRRADRNVGRRGCMSTARRSLSLWVCFLAIAVGLLFSGCADRKPGMKRVGILCGLDVLFQTVEGFKGGMQEMGYVEGVDIAYDVKRTNFDPETEERILRKFVADRVDVILVFPSEPAITAKEVSQGTPIPVVFCQTYTEGTNLIKSVPEPGGNITGVRFPGPDLALKRFEILHELLPQAKVFWVPYARDVPIVPPQLAVLRPVAEQAGITLVESPFESPEDLFQFMEQRDKAGDIGIDAVLLISEPLTRIPAVFEAMGKFAFKHHIPIGGTIISSKEHSTLFGVAAKSLVSGRLAAVQTHKILKGMPAGSIPVISAESFFQLNYKVARELGLNVPEGLLKQADEIIR